MTAAQEYFLKLLKSALGGEVLQTLPNNAETAELFSFSREHGLLYTAVTQLQNIGYLPSPEINEAVAKEIVKDATQRVEVDLLKSAFAERKTHILFFKGSVTKNIYPKSIMRTMHDVDILAEDTEKSNEVLVGLGYEKVSSGELHTVYHKEPVMNVELHSSLESDCPSFADLESYTYKDSENPYLLHMTPKAEFVYCIAHIARHIRSEGINVRSVLDVYLLNKRYANIRASFDETLEECGLLKTAEVLQELAEIWFEGRENNPQLQPVADYILSYSEKNLLRRAHESEFSAKYNKKNGSVRAVRFSFYKAAVFPPVSVMKEGYPILCKAPVLLPFCWVIRGVRTLLFRKNRISAIKNGVPVTDDEIKTGDIIRKTLGL